MNKENPKKTPHWPLFEECLVALGNKVTVLDITEDLKLEEFFKDWISDSIGFSRIDWSKVSKKVNILQPQQLIKVLEDLLNKDFDPAVYIFSSDSYPIIKTDLYSVISNFDDVTCLGFEVWLFNPSQEYVIERCCSGEMNAGIFPIKLKSMLDLLLQLELVTKNQYLDYKLQLLEYKLHQIFEKIKFYETLDQAEIDFALLLYIRNLLKDLKFKKQVDIGLNLWNFAKNFARIDDKRVRQIVFNNIKDNKYNFSVKLIESLTK